MFLTLEQIVSAVQHLRPVHPFFGITFLACKAEHLPVGHAEDFTINDHETALLERYYKPDPDSGHYYRVFRVGPKGKDWLNPNYPSSGSQKTRTTTFRDVFIHPTPTRWGWEEDYVEKLASKFHNGRRVPAFDLAVWLYRRANWRPPTLPDDIVAHFLDDFSITREEQEALFDTSVPRLPEAGLFQESEVRWDELRRALNAEPAPDASPAVGGALAYLELQGVGPARSLTFEPGERLSLITGDNGLGKTFLLECAWWALTGEWAGRAAYPRTEATTSEPRIVFEIARSSAQREKATSAVYDWKVGVWQQHGSRRPTIPGLLVYARVDGSFAVWDPAQQDLRVPPSEDTARLPRGLVFARDQVWDGLRKGSGRSRRVLCNGLLHDWVTWQNKPDEYPFEVFEHVLRRLSPPAEHSDIGELVPGKPVRLPGDAREIPTLKHPYDDQVPIVYASAGIRRITAMAYLIVWAWDEHKTQSGLIRVPPEKRMVVLIDEIEAHLHPQWQRAILPALLEVQADLDTDLNAQLIAATHSPLVTASVEPLFDETIDKLLHLDIEDSGPFPREVLLEDLPFIRHGSADAWLTSDVFELVHARALEAEGAIEEAKALQLSDSPSPEDVQRVSDRLVKVLSAYDEFWPRWKYFAEQHGAHL